MYPMQHLFSAAALSILVALTGVPCAQAQKTTGDHAALRKEVESTYQQVRAALKAKNYDVFVALYEHPAGKPVPKAQWPEASAVLAEALPELSKMRFIRLISDDDWVGYFFQELDNDPNFITVTLFRFHRVGQGWKLNGAVQSSSIRKEKSDTENNAEIQKWIESKKDIRSVKR